VSASGTPPLSYQWTFNGAPLGGQTTTQLVLVNIQAAQLGDYGITVSNNCGTDSASPFTLSADTAPAPIAPLITAMQLLDGTFQLTFATKQGQTYAVDYKNNLSDPSWTLLATIPGDGQDHMVSDAPPLPVTKFYRVRIVIP
jgi:hypothetical protein